MKLPLAILTAALLAPLPRLAAAEPIPGTEPVVYRDLSPEPLKIHIAKPDGWKPSDRRPALVWFFGGGFLRGTPLQSAGWARQAAKWGMVGFAPDYRTRERFGTDGTACISDAREALRWIQENADSLGVDPERIVGGGSSAGGHLALWCAISASPPGSDSERPPLHKPVALLLSSAAADVSSSSGLRADRFGGHADACSPLQNLDPRMPPVLMFHGDADTVVPYSHGAALHKALAGSGNECEFVTVPGGSHNFASDLPEWRERMRSLQHDFLTRLGVIPKAPPSADSSGN